MGKKCKSLRDCKTHRDFENYVLEHGGEITHGGNHDKIRGPKGITVISRKSDSRDFPEGTRRALIRQIIAIGLTCFAVLCAYSFIF